MMTPTTPGPELNKPLKPGQPLPRSAGTYAGMHRAATRNGRWRWKIPRQALVQGLQAGHSLSEIARSHGANQSTASRAVRSLSVDELSGIVVGKAQSDSASPEIAIPDLQTPIDVMGEITGVMDDIRHLRAWLVSEEGRASLRTPQRIAFLVSLLDKRLNAATALVHNRERLLKIIGTDLWIREILALLDEEDACPSCHTAMHLKARVMEKIRQKLVGEIPLVSVSAPRNATGGKVVGNEEVSDSM